MSKPFAKLFDTERGQLLVFIEPDWSSEGDYGPCVRIKAAVDEGVVPELKEGPWPDDDAGWAMVHRRLAHFDQAEAERSATSLHAIVAKLLSAEA